MSKSDMCNVKNAFKVIAVLLIALILTPIPFVQAAVLCSYSGPDVSDDLLELSDFEVIGPEPLRVGDTPTVVFTLKSVEVPVQFGEHGVFVAARDPEGMDRDFGRVYQYDILDNGESINFKATITVDREGEWTFWPGYYIIEEEDYGHFGPDRWHACYLTVNRGIPPPTAYIDIYPNPARDGERVTFEGYGEDKDGVIMECRWTFPDGRTFLDSGSSSWFTLEPEDIQAGWYSFAVRDDEGAWSEEVWLELELETSPTIPWTWILAAIVLVIAAVLIIRKAIKRGREDKERDKKGSIYADSNPQNALIYLDTVYSGLSPTTMHEVPLGNHNVKFRKFGYFDCEREAMDNANQKTHIHCDLTEIPGIKLKLSAEPTEIPADGESKSIITIRIEDNNGKLILVPEDVTVELVTNKGTIESPIKISAGPALVTTTLTSSNVKETATVEAKSVFLRGGTTVEFLQST